VTGLSIGTPQVLWSSPRSPLASIAKAREAIEKYPEAIGVHMHLVAAAAMQGPHDAAAEALAELLRVRPDFSLAWASDNIPHVEEIRDRLLEGLRKAGVLEE